MNNKEVGLYCKIISFKLVTFEDLLTVFNCFLENDILVCGGKRGGPTT